IIRVARVGAEIDDLVTRRPKPRDQFHFQIVPAVIGGDTEAHGPPSQPVAGFRHPPTGETMRSTSLGPEPPRQYSGTRGGVCSMGSTIRQASSTESSRANSVVSPAIASPRTRS